MNLGDTAADAAEGENKYQRRKNATFLGKLIKAHEIHPKYKVIFELYLINVKLMYSSGGYWCNTKNYILVITGHFGRIYTAANANQGIIYFSS